MDYKNKDILYDLYVIQRKTVKEISKILNCGKNSVHRYLKEHKISRRKCTDYTKPICTKEQLISLYVTQQKTMQEIAVIFNCGSVTIGNYLRKYNIPIRNNKCVYKLDIDKKKLIDLYIKQRKTTIEIGVIYNCSAQVIGRYLKKYDIPRRRHTDYQEPKCTKQQLIDLYVVQQKTLQEIAAIFGFKSINSIYNYLIKYDVTYRRYKDITWQQRFLKNIQINGINECWEWLGCKNNRGYGSLSGNHRQEGAHRLSYIYFRGPIPDGMVVCHTCDNPSCVNPNHLFLGTLKDNTQDMFAKKRQCGKFTQEQAKEIVEKHRTGYYTHKMLAKEYDVCRTTISRLLRGKIAKYQEIGV